MGNSLLKLCSSLNGTPTDVMKPPAQCEWLCMRSGKQWHFYFHWFTYNNDSYHFECIACTWIGAHFTYSLSNPQNCTRYILHIILWGFLLLLLFQTLDFSQGHRAGKRCGSKGHSPPRTPFHYLCVSEQGLGFTTPVFPSVLCPMAQRSSTGQGPRRHAYPLWHPPERLTSSHLSLAPFMNLSFINLSKPF